jgi:hypothetical protein
MNIHSRKCGIFTQCSTTQPKEELNYVVCKEMDGTGGHHVK